MPVNRNALLRYKTIDKCLQNRFRKWTLENLIDACSDALYEYEGIDKGISKRTIQADIQMMRSDKLGYNAPIIVRDKKYYTYKDPNYTITNSPLSKQDFAQLSEAMNFLKQLQGFSHFKELGGLVQKLEDQVYSKSANRDAVIDFEKNENLKGLQYLDVIYRAIIHEKTIEIAYKSFRAREAGKFVFHPYLLKEYRNRWFVFGLKNKTLSILTLALDRIEGIADSDIPLHRKKDFDHKSYFKNVIGVTVNPNEAPRQVVLFFDRKTAPYILTKPLHASQQVLEQSHEGTTISLFLQVNYEFERVILGYGSSVKVISPASLKRRIKSILGHAVDLYETEINSLSLGHLPARLNAKGFEYFDYCYTKKEINLIREILVNQAVDGETDLLARYPKLENLVFNKNFGLITKAAKSGELLLLETTYKEAGNEQDLQQYTCILQKEKKKLNGRWKKAGGNYEHWPDAAFLKRCFIVQVFLSSASEKHTRLEVLPGSHKEMMDATKRAFICRNTVPRKMIVDARGIFIRKPLLLYSFSHTGRQKVAFIELVFYQT